MEGTREKLPAQVQREAVAAPQQLAEGMDVAEVVKHDLETKLVQVLDLHSLAEFLQNPCMVATLAVAMEADS